MFDMLLGDVGLGAVGGDADAAGAVAEGVGQVFLGADARFGAGQDRIVGRQADDIFDLVPRIVAKARAGKLGPDEMTGSTFSISNMGMLDVENFTAIINTGEAAILAVSSVLKKPVVRDDKMVVRSVMKMTLSSDHRLIDGALAARFVNAIRKNLEEINLWQRLT